MADATGADEYRPNIFARTLGKESVVTVVGAGAAPTGPWSYVTGIPNPGSDMVGPPPPYLSVAAWAAWTVVTLVGVAYRGNIALDDIKVDFEVEPIGLPNAIGFGVKETVTLFGQVSEQERVRLERASSFCPVGQALTKGSMQVEDEIQWASGELLPASPTPDGLKPLAGSLPSIPPGTVHAQYLLDTKEIDESEGMVLEGEAKVTVRCDNLTRSSGWIVLGGHSTLGWVPGPFPLAHGGWAASTAATLSQLLPQTGEELKVELAIARSSGGPAESQANAAAGVVAHRQVSRRITVPGTPQSTPIEMVQAALLRDPMSITYQHGGILLEHNVGVG